MKYINLKYINASREYALNKNKLVLQRELITTIRILGVPTPSSNYNNDY